MEKIEKYIAKKMVKGLLDMTIFFFHYVSIYYTDVYLFFKAWKMMMKKEKN